MENTVNHFLNSGLSTLGAVFLGYCIIAYEYCHTNRLSTPSSSVTTFCPKPIH